MKYVIGLGNPGDKYANTRHNVGRMALEKMADKAGFSSWSKSKSGNCLYNKYELGDESLEFLLPETFMNRSGETVQYVVRKHGATAADFIVVHDDIDLPFGEVKIAANKGAGGNNGVQSIIKVLGSKEFVRVRIGIAPKHFITGKTKRPAGGGELEKFVLKPFSVLERTCLSEVLDAAAEAIELIVQIGANEAMNKLHSKNLS